MRGKPLHNLNELEWVNGEIYANVWQSDALVRIDPETGAVIGIVDLRGLLQDEDIVRGKPTFSMASPIAAKTAFFT